MLIEPDITGASIVLMGNFNPAILSPAWFVRHHLFKNSEVNWNDPEFITHPQVTQFKLDWCQVVVEPGRFTISGTRDPFVQLADLTAKTFGEFLPHTPIHQFGISRQVHFRVASVDIRDEVGFRLAPPDAWGEWGAKVKARSNSIRETRSLTMEQRAFDMDRTGFISTTVEPSNVLPRGIEIFLQVNDHHVVSEATSVEGALAAMTMLQSLFNSSRTNAEKIIDHVMRLANEAAT